MKILYLSYGPQSGVVNRLSQELRSRNHEVVISDVASPVKLPHISSSTGYLVVSAMLTYKLQWHQGYLRTNAAFEVMSKKAERLVAETRPDMVLQSGCYFGLSNPRVPYVLNLVHTHALSQARAPLLGVSPLPRTAVSWLALERSTYHRAHRIVAMSNFVGASLIHDYGVNESIICVVGSGPILPTYPDIVQHQDDGRTVLFVGLRFENKGGPTLLRAMERVRQSVPDAQLLVAGVSRPSTDNVRYLGRVPKDEIGNYYTKATVFALPTLSESSYPLVFVEAMAYGLPCIGSDIEAIPEIIADGETGFIVPPANDAALAERLIQLLKDPELRRRMGNAGRARQERLYTWGKVADAIEASLHQ